MQELEGKLHWAVWAVELGMLKPSDLPQAVDSQAMDAAAAILSLYGELGRERPRKEGVFVGILAGCERDMQRLSTTALTYLSKVSSCMASTTHDNTAVSRRCTQVEMHFAWR